MKNNEADQNPWTTLTTKTVYDNPWIKITHRDVLNPNGGKGIYGVVHFKNIAIGILPLDEAYNTWIVGQYRYPTKHYSWEIPEGGGALDIEPLESAKRELKEEVGVTATEWIKILDTHLSNSITDECSICYVAKGLIFGASEPEETEQLVVKKIHFDTLFEWVMSGKVTDSLTVMTVLKAKHLMLQGKI